jgi:acyl carrier protein
MERAMDLGLDRSGESPNSAYLEELWSTQLKRPGMGIREDFFEAGGTSMQIIEMLITVTTRFGKQIDYEEFFQEPCIGKLSELLQR